MSLRTIGYTPEGKPIRVDEGPGYVGSAKLGGSLVTGDPSSFELVRRAENAKRYREAKAAR